MHGNGRNALPPQAVDLILHERDERRDYYAQPLAGQSGHLIGERLAASRGHQGQRIASVEHGAYYRLLPRAKLRVAPVLSKHLDQIGMFGPVKFFHIAAKLTNKEVNPQIFRYICVE